MHPMLQRIERGRQAPANNGSFWSREDDSRTRNFSALGKEDEGRFSSTQRRREGAYDHREMDDGWQNGYHGEPKRLKTTSWGDQQKAIKHSSQPMIVWKVEHHNPLINRPNGKLVRVRSLRLKPEVPIIKKQEPEVPIRKKQEIEANKPLPFNRSISSEDSWGKEKIPFDEKKWMYRNEHGKMCGPYPLRQLMEGLDTRFLPEDLLIHEVHGGELGQPMKLKQLVAEARGRKGEMAGSGRQYNHSPTWPVPPTHRQDPCHLGSRSQTSFMPLQNSQQGWLSCDSSLTNFRDPPLNKHPTGPWNSQEHQCSDYSPGSDPLVWASEDTFRMTENVDIPPGFESSSSHFSVRESHAYSPFPSTSAARADSICTPSSPGFIDKDLSEPPGFGAHAKGRFFGHPDVHMDSSSEGAQGPYSSFGKMDSKLYGQNGTSEQVSSCYNSSRPMQERKNLGRTDTWTYAPASAIASSYEGQEFPPPPPPPPLLSSPPAVCIGMPVSMPRAHRSAPWHQQVNVESFPKYGFGFTLGHDVDPLPMIQQELLSAVSASYVKSVLSATISEHLEYWLRASNVVGKALVSEQGSSSSPHLLSRGDNQVQASSPQVQGDTPLASQGIEKLASSPDSTDVSVINSVLEQHEEPHHPPINNMSNIWASVGLPMSSEVDNAMSDAGKCLGKSEDSLEFGKSGSCVQWHGEGPCPPGYATHDPGQARQQKSDGQTVMDSLVGNESHSSVTPTNQGDISGASGMVPPKERDHVKHLEQLLVMASKRKRREKKKSLAVKSKKKKACIGEDPEALKRKQGMNLAHVDHEGCAWTGDDGLSRYNQAGHAQIRDVMDGSNGLDAIGDPSDIWSETQVAQSAASDMQTLELDSQPNCVSKVGNEGSTRVLYSERGIRAGEELMYDYNVLNGGQRLDCTCGSARCGGSLKACSIEEAQPEAAEPYDITCS